MNPALADALSLAALDPGAWDGVAAAFVRAFPGTCVVVGSYDVALGESVLSAAAGYDPEALAAYGARFSRSNPYQSLSDGLPVGRVVRSEELIPEAELLRTEFWADWLRPQDDLRHARTAVLARNPARFAVINCHVARRAMPQVGAGLERALGEAAPLLRRSLEINRMLLGLRLDAASLRVGVEPDGAATFLLGSEGAVLYANARAASELTSGDLVYHDPVGRLRSRNLLLAARLEATLRGEAPPGLLRLAVDAARPNVEAHLLALGDEAVGRFTSPVLLGLASPAALLILRRHVARPSSEHLARERLGLTPAEASVAVALSEGRSIAEIAEARRVSRLTVRDQVRRAIEKVGGRRQADLVARIVLLRAATDSRH